MFTFLKIINMLGSIVYSIIRQHSDPMINRVFTIYIYIQKFGYVSVSKFVYCRLNIHCFLMFNYLLIHSYFV